MTATLERWWTPDGQIDVEDLLKPGSDPQKDLGLGLLALHKAGAEACNLVAKTAIADEHVLVAALAETRALTAPLAVETIAKSVDGPAYAGLLLKDLLDDAEVAALALYRTCLAKSVAPPIAAERVGMVYGVASRDMGKYAQLASDPKANPRAVADLADRTLFDFVSKVVTEEYVPAKETFSKAPADYEERHNVAHGSGGRYVREHAPKERDGGANPLQALFDQAEEREKVGTPAKDLSTGPEVAKPKSLGSLGSLRSKGSLRSLEAAPATLGASTVRASTVKGSLLGLTLSPEEVALQSVFVLDPSPMPLGGLERNVPPLDKAESTPGPNAPIERAISFILPDAEFLSVSREAGDLSTGHHALRLGPLEEYAGRARLYDEGPGSGQLHDHHVSGVEHTLDILESRIDKGEAAPLEGAVPASVLLTGGQLDEAKLRAAKQAFVEKKAKELGIRVNVAQEISKVRHAALKSDMSQMALIWRPPTRNAKGQTQQAPIPGIVEIVVPKGVGRGRAFNQGNVILDGSTPVKMRSLFDKNVKPEERVQVWDDRLKAFRTMVMMSAATEEDISSARWKHRKADSGYLEEHNVVNGPRGRFVAEREATHDLNRLFAEAEAREAHHSRDSKLMGKPKALGSLRSQRSLQGKTITTQAATVGASTVGAERVRISASPEILKAHTLALKAAKARKNDLDGVLLDIDDGYGQALPPAAMDQLMRIANFNGFADKGAVVPISHDGRVFLAEWRKHSDTNFINPSTEVAINAIGSWNLALKKDTAESRLMPTDANGEREVLTHPLTERSELIGLGKVLADKMDKDPTLTMLRVRATPRRDGRTQLIITGNVESLPEQHVVRQEDVEHVNALVADKTYRIQNAHSITFLLDTILDRMEKMDQGVQETIANPHVRLWRAEEQP